MRVQIIRSFHLVSKKSPDLLTTSLRNASLACGDLHLRNDVGNLLRAFNSPSGLDENDSHRGFGYKLLLLLSWGGREDSPSLTKKGRKCHSHYALQNFCVKLNAREMVLGIRIGKYFYFVSLIIESCIIMLELFWELVLE